MTMYKSKCCFLLLISYYLLQWYCTTVTCNCVAPEDPIKCSSGNSNCIITNSQESFPDRSICRAADVVYPTTEAEIISAVSTATMKKRKIKVATRYSHSVPKLVCPDGEDSLVISTKKLNEVLKVDKEAKTITVQSGMTLKRLIKEAAKYKLVLPHTPYWWGLTVGGMLGTGAHGSSWWLKGSAVHDYVVELRIISPGGDEDGYYKNRTLKEGDDDDLNAAKVSLGVLGVISQVTFKLEPLFKRSITLEETNDDSGLGEEALNFGKKHEFGDITWYPSQHKVMYRIDDRVPSTTPGNGVNNYLPFQSIAASLLVASRKIEELAEAINYADLKCFGGKAVSATLKGMAFGLTNNGKNFKGYPVIGYQNKLQASGGCLTPGSCLLKSYCPWDPRIDGEYFFIQGFSIGISKVKNFIQDVQKLVELEPKSLCGLDMYNGILMRYVSASTAYLGKDEDGIDFDIPFYRSKDPMAPRMFEDILEETEQMAMFKYRGMPHWGKNRNVAFEGAIKKYKDNEKFLDVKQRYDPSGLFSNDWTDQVLGLKEGLSIYKEGCALEGLCICSEDIHCSPKKGYFCKPGRVYKEAKVCRKVKSIGII
ncbi:probable L-gulonolactone oxidase 4 [Chenopodium quinoa]|uniref:probable L-gulonolactone oxidase 4 n=1 Tax=Chenopodium quinoa TaxID=63459 RepID=UPI000B782EF8|nr:probable L-gulonolactone oxidase 4 [Chenopodium quinoa]